MFQRKRILSLLNNQEYGRVLNILLKIKLDKLDKKERSNYRLIKGILWELLGNFPKALENYKKSLISFPKNVIAFQYQTQLLAVMGKYPLVYQRLFFRPRKIIFLRDIEGKPLKLKEWFDKKYNREFW